MKRFCYFLLGCCIIAAVIIQAIALRTAKLARKDPPASNGHRELISTVARREGMTRDQAGTVAHLTAAQTFRVPLEIVSVQEGADGFSVMLRSKVDNKSTARFCSLCGARPACHSFRKGFNVCNDCDHNARG